MEMAKQVEDTKLKTHTHTQLLKPSLSSFMGLVLSQTDTRRKDGVSTCLFEIVVMHLPGTPDTLFIYNITVDLIDTNLT